MRIFSADVLVSLMSTILLTGWSQGEQDYEYDEDILDSAFPESYTLKERILIIENAICGSCKSGMGYPSDTEIATSEICSYCYCDTVCSVYQDCCSDVLLMHNVTYDDLSTASCNSVVVLPLTEGPPLGADLQRMITKCPQPEMTAEISHPDYFAEVADNQSTRSDDVRMCEQPNITDIEQMFPVTSGDTRLTYRNIHCARCHDDSHNISRWEASVHCNGSSTEFFLRHKTKKSIFQILISEAGVQETRCEMKYDLPVVSGFIKRRKCLIVSSHIISSCNVTGRWIEYDVRLEEACAIYTSVYLSLYKNMFCYLCNIENSTSRDSLSTSVGPDSSDIVVQTTFSALINFEEDSSEEELLSGNTITECKENQYFDSQKCVCATPTCSEGKYLTNNGSCKSLAVSNIFGYRICVQWDIVTDSPILEKDVKETRYYLITHLSDGLPYKHKDSVDFWCPGYTKLSMFIEEFFTMMSTLEDIELAIQNRLDSLESLSLSWLSFTNFSSQISLIDNCSDMFHNEYPCPLNKSLFINTQQFVNLTTPDFDGAKIHYFNYFTAQACPYIDMNLEDFIMDNSSNYYVFRHSGKNISRSKILEINATGLRVCLSDYLHLLDDHLGRCKSTRVTVSDTWTVGGLISIICTCISLLCLSLTFMAYVILPPLRTGDGKTILTIVVTLFSAQAFYEFAIEQAQFEIACKVFGVVIHYSWLAAMFSMNACTVERFCKLRFPLQSRAFFLSNRAYVLSIVYTLTCPLVIVVLNVIVNEVTRGNIGYGNSRLCYINAAISRIITFALPMGTVAVVNLCLLVIAIRHLRNRTTGGSISSSHTKVGLVACVRLSTVTGVTWILAFLYEIIPNDIISYIITALIGLQGFTLFASLILNKRVLSYVSDFCSSFGHENTSSAGSESRSSHKKTASTALTN